MQFQTNNFGKTILNKHHTPPRGLLQPSVNAPARQQAGGTIFHARLYSQNLQTPPSIPFFAYTCKCMLSVSMYLCESTQSLRPTRCLSPAHVICLYKTAACSHACCEWSCARACSCKRLLLRRVCCTRPRRPDLHLVCAMPI